MIALPAGWLPEGIAKGPGTTMFSGSRATGDVIAVNVATGTTRLAVDAPAGRSATGLEQDRWGRLWVSGGATGQGYVYAADGSPVATFSFGTPPTSFINDVVITRERGVVHRLAGRGPLEGAHRPRRGDRRTAAGAADR